MKKLIYIFIIVVLSGFVSCKKNKKIEVAPSTSLIQIETMINGYIPVRSPQLNKDGEGNFIKTDEYTVLFNNQTEAQNITFGNDIRHTWESINPNLMNNQLMVAGVYPITSSNNGQFSWVTKNDGINNDDLLIANNIKITPKAPITLNFKHAMCKLVINLTNGEGVTEQQLENAIINVKGIKTSCNIDVLNKTSESTGEPTTISKTGKQIVLILPPQSMEGVVISYTLNGIKNIIQTNLHRIEANNCITIEYNVVASSTHESPTTAEIGNVTIGSWEDGDTINTVIQY